jgi:hypothetical protein
MVSETLVISRRSGRVGTSNCDWYRRAPHVSRPQKAAHARAERWGYEWLPGQVSC